jgi:glycosyltransferase involved in cell wall biosynthesis
VELVSVVVPTFNSAKILPCSLESVKNQSYPNVELLVVDNYSQDQTSTVAASYGAKVILFRGTQAAARNIGVENSHGEYILFLDSDQKLDREVISECESMCASGDLEAVKIPEVFVGVNFWGKSSALWKNSNVRGSGEGGGIPRFYRRSRLLKASTLNGQLRWWEDLVLYQHLSAQGLKEGTCHSGIVHFEADSPRSAVRKYLTYGKSVTAFHGAEAKVPFTLTVKDAVSAVDAMLSHSGRSMSVFAGCVILVIIKLFSAALGFLSRTS